MLVPSLFQKIKLFIVFIYIYFMIKAEDAILHPPKVVLVENGF